MEEVKSSRGRAASKFRQALAKAAPEEKTISEETTQAPDLRPPLRSAMRDDDPRERARKRAAEIRGNVGSLDEGVDDFYVDPGEIPDGWTYEWKRRTIANMEDPAYEVSLARMGWEPVPASRHPNMMPTTGAHQTIERKGMILMERPMELSEEARSIELRRARQQVNNKKSQLGQAPDGQFGRDHAQVKPKISNSYEPLPIPKD